MSQKGLAPILIIVFITAAIISVGGYFVYQNQTKSPPTPQQTTQSSPKPAASTTPSAELPKPVELAKQDLAKTLRIDSSQITILSVEEIMWSNGSLGCPEPGMVYIQVIIPGYKTIFSYNQKTYEYHTDKNNGFVTCQPK